MRRLASEALRLDFLDVLRAIAALLVFTQHLGELLWPEFRLFTATWFQMGQAGVMLFFLVSGFIVPASLERAGSVRQFWVTRILRLYPLYWFSLVLALALAGVGLLRLPRAVTEHPVETALANATMLQAFLGHPDVMGLYWTLAFEMAFYGLLSVLFPLGMLRRPALPAGLALASTFVVAVYGPWAGGLQVPVVARAAGQLSSMFVGLALYRWYQGRISTRCMLLLAAGALITLATALRINLLESADPSNLGIDNFVPMGSAWLAAYAVFGVALMLRDRPAPRVLTFLGRISFSLYLMQQFVIAGLSAGREVHPMVRGVFFLAGLAALIAVSTATYYLIEGPFIAMGRRPKLGRSPFVQPAPGTAERASLATVLRGNL